MRNNLLLRMMHPEFLNFKLFMKYALNDGGNITLLFRGRKNIGQC
jgi:hypothetical protein